MIIAQSWDRQKVMTMAHFDDLHKRYNLCIKEAHKRGKFKIEYSDLTEAKRGRVAFYNYFRYLKSTIKSPRTEPSERERVEEILRLAKELSFKCYKGGVLELEKRVMYRDEKVLARAMEMKEEDKKPTMKEVEESLWDVEGEELDVRGLLNKELGGI